MKRLLPMKRMLIWFSVGMFIGGCAASHTQTAYGEGEEEPSPTATLQHEVPSPSTSVNYAKVWNGEYEGEADVYLIRENRWLRNKRFWLYIFDRVQYGSGNIRIRGGPGGPLGIVISRGDPEGFEFDADVDNLHTIRGDFKDPNVRAECSLTKTDEVITGEVTSYTSEVRFAAYHPSAKYVFTVKRTTKKAWSE